MHSVGPRNRPPPQPPPAAPPIAQSPDNQVRAALPLRDSLDRLSKTLQNGVSNVTAQ